MKQSLYGSLRRDAHWKCLILTLLISGCLAAIAWCHLHIFRGYPPRPSSPSSLTSASASSSPSLSSLSSTLSLSLSSSSLPSWSTTSTFISSPAPESQSYSSNPQPERQEREAAAAAVADRACEEGYVYIPVAFVVMLYLVYLVECWHSHTRLDLQCQVDINAVYDKIRDMRDGVPIIWWKAICYHYVRRSRQITRYRNGDAFTSTQVYYERINTCTAGSAFNFTQCGVKDISRSLLGLEDHPATKIRFSKGFSFASVESEYEFEEQRSQFFQEYEARDDYMEGREGMDILNVNFKEHMMAFADPEHLPWYLSHLVFWVASFLLLSWPLRLVIEYRTAHLHFHVHKLFGVNYVDVAETLRRRRPGGTLTRVSTMNSVDLEMNIRNNNFVAPSYSDALLMMSAARRSSVLSVLTTSAGGGLRNGLSPCVSRSATRSTLHTSGSGTFIPGSLPSVPMTNIRRFHSCTAINLHGDKTLTLPHSGSGNILTAHLLRLRLSGQSTTAVSEDSPTDATGMDRRRWRRKRPTTSVTFCGSFLNSLLPPTLESSESTPRVSGTSTPTRSTTFVTHFNPNTNTTTTTTTSTDNGLNPLEEAESSVALEPSGSLQAFFSGQSHPQVRSSQSMTLNSTGSRILHTLSPDADAPPAYSDALGMPSLQQMECGGSRIVRDEGSGSRVKARGDSRGWRRAREDGGAAGLGIVSHQDDVNCTGEIGRCESFSDHIREDQANSENARLLSSRNGGEAGGPRIYGSVSLRVDLNTPVSTAGSVTAESRRCPLKSDVHNPVDDDHADNNAASHHWPTPADRQGLTPFPPQGLPSRLHQDRHQCQSASSRAETDFLSPQHSVWRPPSQPAFYHTPQQGGGGPYQTLHRASPYQALPATLQSHAGTGYQARSDTTSLPSPPTTKGLPVSWAYDHNRGSNNPAVFPFVLSPCTRLSQSEEPCGQNGVSISGGGGRERMRRSPLPLSRLPAVVSPCWTLSDEDDSLSPLPRSGSWLSLTASTSSLTRCGEETQSLSAGGFDHPSSVSPSLLAATTAAAAATSLEEVGGGGEEVDCIPLQAGGGGGGGGVCVDSPAVLSLAASTRCHSSVVSQQCMETSL